MCVRVLCLSLCAGVCACESECVCVCVRVCVQEFMHACVYVSVCMSSCMHVCVCVWLPKQGLDCMLQKMQDVFKGTTKFMVQILASVSFLTCLTPPPSYHTRAQN